MTATGTRHESKTRLLSAALHVIRAKGYSATRIEDICDAAGLTKGSFFHHFDSKEAPALDAADYWIESTSIVFASAPYRTHADPLDRLQSYLDFRKALLRGELPDVTCLGARNRRMGLERRELEMRSDSRGVARSGKGSAATYRLTLGLCSALNQPAKKGMNLTGAPEIVN